MSAPSQAVGSDKVLRDQRLVVSVVKAVQSVWLHSHGAISERRWALDDPAYRWKSNVVVIAWLLTCALVLA